MKKSLKQVRPEDFDVEALLAAAREGRSKCLLPQSSVLRLMNYGNRYWPAMIL